MHAFGDEDDKLKEKERQRAVEVGLLSFHLVCFVVAVVAAVVSVVAIVHAAAVAVVVVVDVDNDVDAGTHRHVAQGEYLTARCG